MEDYSCKPLQCGMCMPRQYEGVAPSIALSSGITIDMQTATTCRKVRELASEPSKYRVAEPRSLSMGLALVPLPLVENLPTQSESEGVQFSDSAASGSKAFTATRCSLSLRTASQQEAPSMHPQTHLSFQHHRKDASIPVGHGWNNSGCGFLRTLLLMQSVVGSMCDVGVSCVGVSWTEVRSHAAMFRH